MFDMFFFQLQKKWSKIIDPIELNDQRQLNQLFDLIAVNKHLSSASTCSMVSRVAHSSVIPIVIRLLLLSSHSHSLSPHIITIITIIIIIIIYLHLFVSVTIGVSV